MRYTMLKPPWKVPPTARLYYFYGKAALLCVRLKCSERQYIPHFLLIYIADFAQILAKNAWLVCHLESNKRLNFLDKTLITSQVNSLEKKILLSTGVLWNQIHFLIKLITTITIWLNALFEIPLRSGFEM